MDFIYSTAYAYLIVKVGWGDMGQKTKASWINRIQESNQIASRLRTDFFLEGNVSLDLFYNSFWRNSELKIKRNRSPVIHHLPRYRISFDAT